MDGHKDTNSSAKKTSKKSKDVFYVFYCDVCGSERLVYELNMEMCHKCHAEPKIISPDMITKDTKTKRVWRIKEDCTNCMDDISVWHWRRQHCRKCEFENYFLAIENAETE